MSLKTNIVVVNEFTYKLPDGSGTRGATPGDYITGYMAREGAGEAVAPVKLFDADDYVVRYMAREEATEYASDVVELKSDMKDAQKWGGQAFGYGCLSLSNEALVSASKDIQRLFDEGKTVFKTVVSFDPDYLLDNGVVEEGFTFTKRGDYRGHVDQMKLRTAIDAGVRRLSEGYDDLRYIGVIQVDTEHVHCHLCMVDAGIGTLMADGTQRGKLSEKSIYKLRRGIDMSLDESQMVRHMSADVSHDKRNALCFIKKFTHQAMDQNGLAQFLLACLPEDESLWRAGTNRKEMRKPNAIVWEYVTDVLAQPGSGYQDALKSVEAYAKARQEREGLSNKERRKLYDNGREAIIHDCMNGVYGVLKQMPKEERQVRTPMLDVMSTDYEELASRVVSGSDEMVEFGFRLRSYSSRLDKHREERKRYRDAVQAYEQTVDKDPAAAPLLAFFEFEEEYNAQLMCKYQYFLDFLPPEEDYREGFNELVDYRKRMRSLDLMMHDKSIIRMLPQNAEEYGFQVYGQHGGALVRDALDVLSERLFRMGDVYGRKQEDFKAKIAERGMSLIEEDGSIKVSREKPYPFDEVKALDIHHLSFDFPQDVIVSKVNVDRFLEVTAERSRLYDGARNYLISTGQGAALKTLPGRDIRRMKEVATKMDFESVLKRVKPDDLGATKRSATYPLDKDLSRDLTVAIKAAVESMHDLNDRQM